MKTTGIHGWIDVMARRLPARSQPHPDDPQG